MIILDFFPLNIYEYELPYPSTQIPALSGHQQDDLLNRIGMSQRGSLIHISEAPSTVGTLNINPNDFGFYKFVPMENKCRTFSSIPRFFYRSDTVGNDGSVIVVRHGDTIFYKKMLWALRVVDIGYEQIHRYYESFVPLPILLRISMTGIVPLPLGALYYMPPDEEMKKRGSSEDLLRLFQGPI
jgi:hypothetical protein